MQDITAIILTYNEEKHIARCIDNVQHVTKKVYVVDSFSTDRTCEIAQAHGAIVLQNKYVNQAQQFQWALDNIQIDTEWTMRMDADEYLTEELIEELGKLKERIEQMKKDNVQRVTVAENADADPYGLAK